MKTVLTLSIFATTVTIATSITSTVTVPTADSTIVTPSVTITEISTVYALCAAAPLPVPTFILRDTKTNLNVVVSDGYLILSPDPGQIFFIAPPPSPRYVMAGTNNLQLDGNARTGTVAIRATLPPETDNIDVTCYVLAPDNRLHCDQFPVGGTIGFVTSGPDSTKILAMNYATASTNPNQVSLQAVYL